MAIKLISTYNMRNLLRYQYDACNRCLLQASQAPDNLLKLLTIHVNSWNNGIRNDNLGPDPYGMFRTDDVATMKPWEVYLGNVDGIFTHTIHEFENMKDRDMERMRSEGRSVELPDYYVRVCQQYRKHLTNNFMDIRNHVYDKGKNRQFMEEYSQNALNMLERAGGGMGEVKNFRFVDQSLADNKILLCEFYYNNYKFESCMLNLDGRYLIPVGFERGVNITPQNLKTFKYHDVFDVLSCLGQGRNKQPQVFDFSSLTPAKVSKETNAVRDISRKEASRNLDHIRDMKKKGYSFGKSFRVSY